MRVLLRQLGEQTPDIPDELAAFIRRAFDPHGERTARAGLYRPGADPEPRLIYGLVGRTRRRPGSITSDCYKLTCGRLPTPGPLCPARHGVRASSSRLATPVSLRTK